MNVTNRKTSFRQHALWLSALLFCFSVMAFITVAGATEIYKSYDENGNIVYSDQPPEPDAEPLVLPEPNIISSSVPVNPSPPSNSNAGFNAPQRVLEMLRPVEEETFWGTAQALEVSFDVQPDLAPQMRIAIYVDDQRVALISSTNTTITDIDRGTHSVRAELLDSRGNVLTATEPRTFFMKQHSANFNN